MARITDPKRLENIKESTISLIVEQGYGEASIAAIAAKAGVADGYLYRHYPSKASLVSDLFGESAAIIFQHINDKLDNYTSFENFVISYLEGLVTIINERPNNAKFFIQLFNDYTFKIESHIKIEIETFCKRLIEKGLENNEISADTSIVDAYTILMIIPLQIFGLYLKGFFGLHEISTSEIATSISKTCMKIVKK